MKRNNLVERPHQDRSHPGLIRTGSPLHRLLELVAEFIAKKRQVEVKPKR